MSRAADRALLILAAGVALGCLGLGAPPRMDPVEGAAPAFARFLEALGPATIVRVAIAAALALTVGAGLVRLRGDPAASPMRPLLALGALGLIALVPLPGGLIGLVAGRERADG